MPLPPVSGAIVATGPAGRLVAGAEVGVVEVGAAPRCAELDEQAVTSARAASATSRGAVRGVVIGSAGPFDRGGGKVRQIRAGRPPPDLATDHLLGTVSAHIA